MAEGRWLPWKEQKMDIRPFPDYKQLSKPLRAPPQGLQWHRFDDGHWELRTLKKRSVDEEEDDNDKAAEDNPESIEKEERVPEFLEHVVMPDDTLTGICMRYKVKERELRRLNDFIGDKFRMCDTLIVPNRFAAGKQPTQENTAQQPETRDVKLQRFMKRTMLTTAEAKYYLENNGWSVNAAVAEWRTEKTWEMNHGGGGSNGSNVASSTSQGRQTRQNGPLRRRETSRIVYPVVAGTRPNDDYIVAEDGTIEMGSSDHFQEARVPLLAGVARR